MTRRCLCNHERSTKLSSVGLSPVYTATSNTQEGLFPALLPARYHIYFLIIGNLIGKEIRLYISGICATAFTVSSASHTQLPLTGGLSTLSKTQRPVSINPTSRGRVPTARCPFCYYMLYIICLGVYLPDY